MPIAPGTYWHLLDRNTPPVKRRAAHAKARTGCLTCKKRRVKCDEAKPSCARCIKSGHRCAGYEDANSTVRKGSSNGNPEQCKTSAPLRPKPLRIGIGAGIEEHRINLMRASLTPTYFDTRDVPYFERFRCQMLVDLGTWCGAEYWRHKILREILNDNTVQHAALAGAAILMDIEEQKEYARLQRKTKRRRCSASSLTAVEGRTGKGGAPSETAEIEDEREVLPIVTLSNISTHGRAALRHYTTAISLCRQTLRLEGMTPLTARSSLTVTFFFVLFELIQGNIGEANRLLSSGRSLLSDSPPMLVSDNELCEIQLAFDRMSVAWDLCPYFRGQKDVTTRGPGPGVRMRHFELPSFDAPMRTKQVFWNAFSSDFGQFMASLRDGVEISPERLPTVLAQRMKYLTQLRSWLPILEDLCAQNPESSVLCTTKVYAQTAIIFLNCFLDRSDLAYDAYLPVFKDIVATYRRLLPSHAQQRGYLRFTLDVDLFPIITFTVSKCRDRETRALALQVFEEMTRRQALWTNLGMLAALRALADLENKGRDADGFVPPLARYSYMDSHRDFENRRTIIIFVPVLSMAMDNMSTVHVPISF
ncbi:hypothetical protein HD806DRAFT_501757 [Xylariaceae sp. AK1471]|nr:hypothetical protein HD806DRAFT_501757 [Xylariaceae sp. AK1471]